MVDKSVGRVIPESIEPPTLCRMSFGSNGIYVGGKDTFISELTGNWSVKGEVFPQVRFKDIMPCKICTAHMLHYKCLSACKQKLILTRIRYRASWAIQGRCRE